MVGTLGRKEVTILDGFLEGFPDIFTTGAGDDAEGREVLGRVAGGSELFTLGLGRHDHGFLDGTLDGAVGRDVDGLLDGGGTAAVIARSSESFVISEDGDIV
jgi:hypothetical protein